MANDGNILALLGSDDLNTFSSNVAKDNIFSQIVPAISGAQFDTRTWGTGAKIGVPLIQAFLSAALGGIGRSQIADQTAKVASVLPALSSLSGDPSSILAPEGVDETAFNNLKASAILKREQRKASLANEMFSNPQLAGIVARTNPSLVSELFGVQSEDLAPKALPAVESDPLTEALRSGKESSTDRYKKIFNELVAQNTPPQQASIMAREQIAGEVKANTKSFDDVKAARERAAKIGELVNTAEAGMKMAGTTGPLNSLARLYEQPAAFFGSTEANKNIAGDALLNSIGPELVQMGRSPGAVSDRETQMLLGSGPATSNANAANQALITKLAGIKQLENDYADFLETYREVNSGSTMGAEKKWLQYKNAFPIMTVTGDTAELNPNRPSWQDFFSGNVSIPQASIPSVTTPKINASQAEILAELKRRGLR